MGMNIMTASSQLANRPKDESYHDKQDFLQAAYERMRDSKERVYNIKDLQAVARPTGQLVEDEPVQELVIAGPKGMARPTNWAFAQLCKTLEAPSRFVADLTPEVGARVINDRIAQTPIGMTAQLLVQDSEGMDLPTLRAATSEKYGRVWEASLYSSIFQLLPNFDLPPTWEGPKAGAYMGDRDSFFIGVDGGSIVEDPSLRGMQGGGDQMFRGVMVRNSEVGRSRLEVICIMFRYICGNHIIWDAVVSREFKRRHIGQNLLRDTLREIAQIAKDWSDRPASLDQDLIKLLAQHQLATSKEAIVDELQAMGLTKKLATAAYEACEEHEAVSPRSFWGVSQGLTRVSQDSGYQDDRLELDQLAALVLRRGAEKVRV